VDAVEELERGREAYARRAWGEAYEALSRADQAAALEAEDLELLATAAYMLGREDDLRSLERACDLYLERGEMLRAARCAGWVGMHLFLRGAMGPATGWLGRAERLVERERRECVERGYLLFPALFRLEAAGDYDRAAALAAEIAAVGERFRDADLIALASQQQGLLLVKQGRVAEGLRHLDEAMVGVMAGELSPIVSGFVYCGVIATCEEAYELRRAIEWTEALARWCEEQPDLVAFTGRCLVHRAGILQLHGAWRDALVEAQRASDRCAQGKNRTAAAEALYRQGELHRLRGELAAAEQAYREASRGGFEPQPGLALLRLAQGNLQAARAAIRRALAETGERSGRARLLPAYVEIMLALGEMDDARRACTELEEIAAAYESAMLAAGAAHARGALSLAEGNAEAALPALRRAWRAWCELEAPYEAARVRVLVGLACRALGDEDSSALELDAARAAFEQLGAAVDLARVDSLATQTPSRELHGLTPRELEVLRLVACGKSNKEIATALVISEHTVARHVQNIFAKLGIGSRTAAAAFAFEHALV
jgi:DNA-binding CsgD family transcriptional regulator